LVVPTCRPANLRQFLDAWQPFPWGDTVVVVDLPEPIEGLPAGVRQFCWGDLERHPAGGIISRKDSACRCFGFLQAVASGADLVFTLDDDCFPVGDPAAWVRGHRQNLRAVPAWASSVPGLRVRGLPYEEHLCPLPVGVSMGLWTDHPDLDATTRLASPVSNYQPPSGVRVMSRDQLFPFCGMNFAFRREVLPAMYFPPMGEGSPYSRFDDIWCGLVAQTVLHHLGYRFTVGEPFIRHKGAGDVYEALRRESPGMASNEWVWRLFLGCELSGTTVTECVVQVADYLLGATQSTPDAGYVTRWGEALKTWCRWAEHALLTSETGDGGGHQASGPGKPSD
jgi:reversibly glycosylated polypeptide/UDP-arabinopyranose mutase